MPKPLRCLIVGESPGDVTSEYFYEPPTDPKHDRVRVQRELLDGLEDVRLVAEPTLEAFRDGGFLFDHAIRCPLPFVDRKSGTAKGGPLRFRARGEVAWLEGKERPVIDDEEPIRLARGGGKALL